MDVRLDVEVHDAELNLPLIRPEEQDPVEAVTAVEPDHVVVERPALLELLRQDVWLDPLDRHRSRTLIRQRAVHACRRGAHERRARRPARARAVSGVGGAPVEPVASFGTDNALYRLGDALVARLPRREVNERSLKNERHWLPRLASHLPFDVPTPLVEGAPVRATRSVGCLRLARRRADADQAPIASRAAESRRVPRALRRIDPTWRAPHPAAQRVPRRAARSPGRSHPRVIRGTRRSDRRRRRDPWLGGGSRRARLGRPAHVEPRRPRRTEPARDGTGG